MKKDSSDAREASAAGAAPDDDELLPEYDLRSGERGKYAARFAAGTNVVALDPDVAAAFPDPVEVNEILRAVAGIIRLHRRADGRGGA